MKKSFRNLLSSYPESKRDRFSKRLTKFDFRASLFLEEFSASILKQLKDNNGKKKDIAEKLDISKSAVTQLLDPKTNISILKIFELANAVGMTPDFLELIDVSDCLEEGVEVENESHIDTSNNYFMTLHKNTNSSTTEISSKDSDEFVLALVQ
ncbi:MAG: helix-turn-helix transcriptional regulator [Balneola sp.]|nr:helix-turn-helix transcriptional regulator [Balneola sp.]